MPSGNGNSKTVRDRESSSRATFPALAALTVRDILATIFATSMHTTAPSAEPREVITRAFALADEFTQQSQGRWAIDAKRRGTT